MKMTKFASFAQEIARQKIELATQVPDEPEPSTPGSLIVLFKLPSGQRVERRFMSTDSLKVRVFVFPVEEIVNYVINDLRFCDFFPGRLQLHILPSVVARLFRVDYEFPEARPANERLERRSDATAGWRPES